jgi:hypothetical protein
VTKRLEDLSELDRKVLARMIRRQMQGKVPPHVLAERTDNELVEGYYRHQEDRKKKVVVNGAEDDARDAS